ncbi:ribosomal RNA small subunit methyltransferase G [Gordonia hirsuta DSM 44140 = NBRC 16056]|uniref:Ribosomal RNA small subunit methyltransferase G n=1 Tax=Gordonia hirsuta DSM 44140 = NBRC 16056 TaxID=1121927 RepID=L7L9B5_9ACTN|nr:16S rRNA (guanine(527)-N(7))-methyltransferase RsmG [Gordonia hirsuta]GAC57740.1 ribosomal RNA small subunit methyltransferase G [Gordonia hirsuta DSM 44140 = NBRC 16056]
MTGKDEPGRTSIDVECERRPEVATQVFGSHVGTADEFAEILSQEGVLRGLIGPSEPARLWSRHILNSAVIGEAIPQDVRVVDIGSGAGFPGIPLAIARPDLQVVLVEPLLRRTTFLDEAVRRLGLENVSVVRGRAEEKEVIAAAGEADVVTSRAVAPLDRLARWSVPLMRIGGQLVALKGRTAQEEIDEHAEKVAGLGLIDLHVREVGSGVIEPVTSALIGTRIETEADRRARTRADRRRSRKR